MAINVAATGVTTVIDTVLSTRTVTVLNAGAKAVTISKDPGVTSGVGFPLAAGAALPGITLSPGESLYAITGGTDTTTLDVI